MRALAQCQVEADLIDRNAQAVAELLHIAREQDWPRVGGEWHADVGDAHDLARQGGERLADLHAEHGRAHLPRHRHERRHHRGRLGWHAFGQERGKLGWHRVACRCAHDTAHVLGDGCHDALPRGERSLKPLGPTPGEAVG